MEWGDKSEQNWEFRPLSWKKKFSPKQILEAPNEHLPAAYGKPCLGLGGVERGFKAGRWCWQKAFLVCLGMETDFWIKIKFFGRIIFLYNFFIRDSQSWRMSLRPKLGFLYASFWKWNPFSAHGVGCKSLQVPSHFLGKRVGKNPVDVVSLEPEMALSCVPSSQATPVQPYKGRSW